MSTNKQSANLIKMVAALGVITIVSGALLATVYSLTTEPIKRAEMEAQVAAIKAVAPTFDNNPVDEKTEITPEGEDIPVVIFPVTKDGKTVGAAIESYSSAGFSGDISVMVGFDNDGKITGYEVMQQAETPGLGAKMNDWFRDPKGKRSVIGRTIQNDAPLKVTKDGGDVDAITAATISSRAFLDAICRAHKCFTQFKNAD